MTYQEALDYHKEHGKLPDNFCGLTYGEPTVSKKDDTVYAWRIPNWSVVMVITEENKAIVIESNTEQ